MTKTADGKFRLNEVVRVAELLPGVTIENGNRHKYVLKYSEAFVGNCALDKSTHTDKHLIPWFKRVTGFDKQTIYNSLRQGQWIN